MPSDKNIILITGANNGIGFDTAYALANASENNHVIMAARTPSKGEAALEELQSRKPKGTLSLVILDVNSDDSISAAVKKLQTEHGRLDVLVNNAGVMVPGNGRDAYRGTFETNVFGPAILTDALAPLLKNSKAPRIVNVSSGLGSIALRFDETNQYYPLPANAYRASKAALNMITACQNHDYKDLGVKAFAFCPGYVITNLTGEEGRKQRIATGAESSETSAQGILEIAQGQRDGEVKNFLQRFGQQWEW
ncbi:short chain dehydrogenase [Amniculicola lignicola CBS 123094]|uniref:Short chain dehydrogenase n=1 Tax=Amniculicola lignicola CBS 123094 TaxID=1392246 RepID=A0A6A5W182_9PLEO|nr:short chain dehydrogenase [Amniculicola lignicola CBS 123094]